MAWSFYSENNNEGYKINVDMLKAIRTIEKLSGEKLVYMQDLNTNKIIKNKNENISLFEIVEQQKNEIENLKEENRKLNEKLNEVIKKIEIK